MTDDIMRNMEVLHARSQPHKKDHVQGASQVLIALIFKKCPYASRVYRQARRKDSRARGPTGANGHLLS